MKITSGTAKKPRRRYVMAQCERALDLKKAKPAAYQRLPKGLREAAEEYRSWVDSLASEPRIVLPILPPKLQKLIDNVPSLKEYSYPQLLDIPLEVLSHVKIPKKPGPKRTAKTTARIAEWAKLKQQRFGVGRIARKLWPGVPFKRAKNRAKQFWHTHRLEINAALVESLPPKR